MGDETAGLQDLGGAQFGQNLARCLKLRLKPILAILCTLYATGNGGEMRGNQMKQMCNPKISSPREGPADHQIDASLDTNSMGPGVELLRRELEIKRQSCQKLQKRLDMTRRWLSPLQSPESPRVP